VTEGFENKANVRHDAAPTLRSFLMKHYDPDVDPIASEWLALDEKRRIRLVKEHHRAARLDPPHINGHAATHTIVENQIAMQVASVLRAMQRLMDDGLSRHDAVHAVGCVLIEHFHEATTTRDPTFARTSAARYDVAIDRLTAQVWRDEYGG
jgi:hypothetical protein